MMYILAELERKHVTRQLLWEEYKLEHPDGLMYSQFCDKIRNALKENELEYHKHHKAGEDCEVDWAGTTIPYYDAETRMWMSAVLFVGVLPASAFPFARAYPDQKTPSWIDAHVRMFSFFGGTPRVLTPDCTKTAVTTLDLFDPVITKTYDALGRLKTVTDRDGAKTAYGYDPNGNLTIVAYYTRGGDTLIHMVRTGAKSYFLYDGHRSVRMLANEGNAITNTYTFNAFGELTFRTGVTENDYLYAGEKFDAATGLYYLRARYMDPSTGTFISMDTYQGNMFDPVSLHKYQYAHANPVSNTDPTGMFSLSDMSVSMNIQGTLNKTVTLNVYNTFRMIQKALAVINLVSSVRSFILAALTGDVEGMIVALANGVVSVANLFGICQLGALAQTLTRALAVYGIVKNVDTLIKAIEDGDVWGVISAVVGIAVDVVTLFASCFTGDTLVAIEDGYKRIDEIEVGDYVWAYNVETGEMELKEVLQVFAKQTDEILHLGTTVGAIETTTNHPFYVLGTGWVATGDLTIGDNVYTIECGSSVVTGLWIEKLDEPITVYNLEVEEFHSYFVGGLGVLVHNKYEQNITTDSKAD